MDEELDSQGQLATTKTDDAQPTAVVGDAELCPVEQIQEDQSSSPSKAGDELPPKLEEGDEPQIQNDDQTQNTIQEDDNIDSLAPEDVESTPMIDDKDESFVQKDEKPDSQIQTEEQPQEEKQILEQEQPQDEAPAHVEKHLESEEQNQADEGDNTAAFSQPNVETSSALPLQLISNESDFSGELSEIPEQILNDSGEKETEDQNELSLTVNIEDQLKEFDGSDDEGMMNREENEPIENLVDALCDSESSKPGNEIMASIEIHSDTEDSSRNVNVSKDSFEEVDLTQLEREKASVSEENDVLADDRTQRTIGEGKNDHTDDECDESRTESRMDVDQSEHGDEEHVEHIVDDQDLDRFKQIELEDNTREVEEQIGVEEETSHEGDSIRQDASEGDVHMTSIEERITPNNEEDEEETEKEADKEKFVGERDSPDAGKNGESQIIENKQSNCIENQDSETPTDELHKKSAHDKYTEESLENCELNVSDKKINAADGSEEKAKDEQMPVDLEETSEPGKKTRARDAQSDVISKDSGDNIGTPSNEEGKSKTKTRLSRRLSPETVVENNKEKNVSILNKPRKRIRTNDGSSDRGTPDSTPIRSKGAEEIEEIETPEHTENLELKELQIKELSDDLPEEKCNRCRKTRTCQYKYMKNSEIRFLCCLKCVHGFRASSKDSFHLIARKIPISLVFDVQQSCYVCKIRKSCRYRSKRPENESELIYLCDPKCYGSFVGMNVEKFFKRRKAYLVQEVSSEVAEIEKKCIKCGSKSKCLYSFRDDENATHFICDDSCFNEMEKEEENRLKLKRRSVRVRDLGGPADSSSHSVQHTTQSSAASELGNITRTEEEAEQARFDREASLVRRCGECLMIIPTNRNILEWETLPFCSDTCLEKYQNVIGSNCTNCNSLVSSSSMGKYCVRFGFEIRQFCSSHCLDTYKKKNLKECAHCQKDISHDKDGFLAPVGDKSQFKDFCSKSCVKKYEDLLNPRKKQNTGNCAVCNLDKLVRVDLSLDERAFEFCSNPCFSAFKFVNNISPDQCALCLKYFERKSSNAFTLYEENTPKMFCSRICLTVFISVNRKIVSCQWCKVKKYNFDMILRSNAGLTTTLCSITCLRKYLGPGSINAGSSALVVRLQKICDQCHSNCNPTFSLAMSDSTSRNFCTQQCVIDFQAIHKRPVTEAVKNSGQKRNTPYPVGLPKKLQPKSDKSIIRPVQLGQQSPPHSQALSALPTTPAPAPAQVQPTTQLTPIAASSPPTTPSLLSATSDAPSPDFSLPLVKKRGRPKKNIDIYDTDTSVATAPSPPIFRPVKKRNFGTNTPDTGGLKSQIITVPPPQPMMANKQTMCKPSAAALAMQTRRPTCTVELQTDDVLERKYFVPVPVPIYVPQPMHMYSMPFPVPVPIPLPIPVPIFIPTTRNTAAGIMKEIKKIQDKMPADPFEAELLMMAEMVADEKRNESDSEPEEVVDNTSVVEYAPEGDDIFQMDLNISAGYEEQPNVDIETSMPTNAIQQVTPTLEGVNDYMSQQQQQMMMMDSQRRVMPSVNTPRKRAASPAAPRGRLSTTPPQKRHRAAPQAQQQQQQLVTPPAVEPVRPTEPAERPDANMCLKYTFGVNAWRQWVMNKNADIEKSSIRRKTFKTELLQLTADELNYSLCLFVKEVRKPNGSEYAPDTIYYLVLGIQQYLYENGRIDNIFTDPYYERFTDCLDEVARKFSILYNDSQYIVTRVEEEHLWECKQLGAHSPHVLLSTLMFFNTKHFNLTTVDEHMQLSFSHIMKHWKRNPAGKQNQSTRNVLLRFYPPQTTPDNPRKKKVYEQQENESNPLRCPVKLYEFYLSKCPESVKTRSDVFYLQPERSCVPDSPVWYSTQPLSREALNKMLHRVKMVKEINVALLSSQ